MKAFATMAAVATLFAGPAIGADRNERVKFGEGKTAATLRGTIRSDQGVVYSIATVEKQTLQLLFKPASGSCYFNVYAPGKQPGQDEAAFIGSTSGNEFGASPTMAGDYKVQVYLMRNAARRNETCRYQLSIELTGVPGGASAGVSDQMMGDVCKASAGPMYGVQPRSVKLTGKIVAAAGGGFFVDGIVDKKAEGVKKLRCIYKADRQFSHIQAMTSDGE